MPISIPKCEAAVHHAPVLAEECSHSLFDAVRRRPNPASDKTK
jgi:hypothetical protein